MKMKLITLALISVGTSSLFSEHNTQQMINNGCDIVSCKFTPKEAPKNISGGHSVSFRALENMRNQRQPHAIQLSVSEYSILAFLSANTMEKTFYKCMANLDRPDIAVQNGEYKKCVKEAWGSRPWFQSINITVYEETKSNKNWSDRNTILEGRRFSWYNPVKSLSFLD